MNEQKEPLGENQPIPGTPRSRIALIVGLVIALGLVIFFTWFFIVNSDKGAGPGAGFG